MENGTSVPGKPHVFIGSSAEGLEIAQYLQASLEEHRTLEALTWNQGFFAPTLGHLENLEKGAEEFDFAIVVLTPDVITEARGGSEVTARSNVLLEIGFFVGNLGRDRTVVVMREEEVSLPSYLHGVTVQSYPKREDNNLAAAITPVALRIREHVAKLGLRNRNRTVQLEAGRFPVRVFSRSDEGDFVQHMKSLFETCKNLVLIGTGLNILSRDPVRRELMIRAAKGECRLEMYLADPFSQTVQARLIEEELGTMKPPVARAGLMQRLDSILDEWEKLDHSPNIDVRLFGHYPTFALLIVDSDYYVYPYGYAKLGNFSPVIHLSANDVADQTAAAFFQDHYEDVKRDSSDARQVMQLREENIADTKLLHDFALYLVPPAGSRLFEFGSDVLGYDVRSGKSSNSRWSQYVGGAKNFGFHVTCCDALFFFTAHDLRLVKEEISFLAREFQPFEFTGLKVVGGFPDSTSVALVPEDKSGSLEALHYELVQRVYKRAAASNYSLGRAKPTRDNDLQRARLMISRYRAPYILQRYKPHFTLLTSVPPQDMDRVVRELQAVFEERVADTTFRVEKLAIMAHREADSFWMIRREIKLG